MIHFQSHRRILKRRGKPGTASTHCAAVRQHGSTFEPLEVRHFLAGQPQLVLDINSNGATGSAPANLVAIGSTVYFSANDGVHGTELWKSDGTAAGTMLVKDINPGSADSNPKYLTNVNGTLFFSANDGARGNELWKSDGTVGGTMLVADIQPGSGYNYTTMDFGPYSSDPKNLTAVNGTLFFSANDGQTGTELWKSNGTATGTMLVKDIEAFPTLGSYPINLTNVNGTLFFEAFDLDAGFELWKSDGTANGTLRVKDIFPGTYYNPTYHGDFPNSSIPRFLTPINGTLFFAARDGDHGFELWKSDGTTAGTVLVKDIRAGSASSGTYGPSYLTAVNGTLFFNATDGQTGAELWKSDGTDAGTMLVKDIVAGSAGSDPLSLINVNGTLLFAADQGTAGDNELFKSDGTPEGTMLVADINPGTQARTCSIQPTSMALCTSRPMMARTESNFGKVTAPMRGPCWFKTFILAPPIPTLPI